MAKIFAMREAGATLEEIAAELNKEGVPTKRGGRWYAATVRYILQNPKYRGILRQSFQGETFEAESPALRIA